MYEQILEKLSHSKFRSSFKLKEKDKTYILQKGMDTIKSHAKDFIAKRLAPEEIPNDGKQTPMKGHPVFIAQHATATCCRKCLNKWHHIAQDKKTHTTTAGLCCKSDFGMDKDTNAMIPCIKSLKYTKWWRRGLCREKQD